MGFRLGLSLSLCYEIDYNCFYDPVAGVQNAFYFLTMYYWRLLLALLDWRNHFQISG